MFAKMGCKTWTRGSQFGLRIYTPTIHEMAENYSLPSLDSRYNTLSHFLVSVSRAAHQIPPYSRRLLIVDSDLRQQRIEATMTIARHGNTSQGYITAPQNTWLYDFVVRHLGKDMCFEYNASSREDLLVVPYSGQSLIATRSRDFLRINREVTSHARMKHYAPPPDASRIGLHFELEEMKLLRSEGLRPSHRYPYITTRIRDLASKGVTCDIDVFDTNSNFLRFVEVKAVSGAPGGEFNLTVNEWQSREECRARGDRYEIVVYFHSGTKVVERQVITQADRIGRRPSGYWCTVE